MGNECGKNVFRKVLLSETKQNNCPKFRKAIDARMSTPLKENNLERTPNKDKFSN